MNKVFITGSNGFVGSHLQQILNEKEISFFAGDRSLYGDICLQNNWEQLLRGCEGVVHLAARVHVRDKELDALTVFRKLNVDSTINLAKAAKSVGVKRFIFLSSIKVNGEDSFNKAFTANDSPLPHDAYAISKTEAEVELLKLHEEGIFEVVIIRPPLVYGPNVRANFKSLMDLTVKNLPLPFKSVKNKRSFVSVFNLSDFIATCLTHPKASGKIFLISDDQDLSLPELIQKIAIIQNRKVTIFPFPVSIMKLCAKFFGKKSYIDKLFGNLQVDISETKNILGWSPPYTFESTFKN